MKKKATRNITCAGPTAHSVVLAHNVYSSLFCKNVVNRTCGKLDYEGKMTLK
jgi:hypothetical protein